MLTPRERAQLAVLRRKLQKAPPRFEPIAIKEEKVDGRWGILITGATFILAVLLGIFFFRLEWNIPPLNFDRHFPWVFP